MLSSKITFISQIPNISEQIVVVDIYYALENGKGYDKWRIA